MNISRQKKLLVYLALGVLSVALSVTVSFNAVAAAGDLTSPPTKDEIRYLPEYCKVKFEFGYDQKNPNVKRWMGILGANYGDIHHYCKGMVLISRADQNPKAYSWLLQRAIGNFDYIIAAAKPEFILLPEVLVKRGEVNERLGQEAEAIKDYYTAIKANKAYSSPYVRLSRLFMKSDDKDKAREILEEGLRNAPTSKLLKRKLGKLNAQ